VFPTIASGLLYDPQSNHQDVVSFSLRGSQEGHLPHLLALEHINLKGLLNEGSTLLSLYFEPRERYPKTRVGAQIMVFYSKENFSFKFALELKNKSPFFSGVKKILGKVEEDDFICSTFSTSTSKKVTLKHRSMIAFAHLQQQQLKPVDKSETFHIHPAEIE